MAELFTLNLGRDFRVWLEVQQQPQSSISSKSQEEEEEEERDTLLLDNTTTCARVQGPGVELGPAHCSFFALTFIVFIK